MLARAVGFGAALHAAAAVERAEMAERRRRALSIGVALIADLPVLIAAVSAGGAALGVRTDSQTAIGERVACESVRTICGRKASDAAVPNRIAAWRAVRTAVVIACTLHAFVVDTARARQALAQRAASSLAAACARTSAIHSARARAIPSACARARPPASRASGRRATKAGAGARRGRAATPAGYARSRIEFEALIAGGACGTEKCQAERRREPSCSPRRKRDGHGSPKSVFASSAAKPRG